MYPPNESVVKSSKPRSRNYKASVEFILPNFEIWERRKICNRIEAKSKGGQWFFICGLLLDRKEEEKEALFFSFKMEQ